ncbi:MAG: DUF3951 domain-containing protein [Gorillibacterium sp.]|nr:DUF3951 domain-containing protein [Gorillibacterium sp.]
MDFGMLLILSVAAPIIGLVALIVTKLIRNKEIPNSLYTPFDQIMGQSSSAFHEEKQEFEEQEDKGEGKRKGKSGSK